ncbi:hypothetical protein CCR75_007612 [Bremia lactucae]|uniref:Pectin acetylesterase n=1 Tax=Bremia lactucae TaxID=4779 RepID=A0A976ILN4_BRELC|nr:hypothetical protein CCR75_007612 [Bremia lactucae]
MVFFISASKTALALLALPLLSLHAEPRTCDITGVEACTIDSLTASTNDEGIVISPNGNTRCAFDDYTDPVSNFTSRSKYFFQVFPAKNHNTKKLLLYFQGGGACVDELTCNFALQCQLGSNALISTKASVEITGIVNRSLGNNVFNDFNIVYLPYCTGDLFVGNKYVEPLESVYNQALGNKQCLGQNHGMHLNGYNNTMAVLHWALANYQNLDQIVIGGYSAGSLGAQLWSTYVANAWKVKTKGITYQVLADSYVGVFPETMKPASSLIKYYNGCQLLGFPNVIASACEAETATAIEMVLSLMTETPLSEWLFINSIADKTQRGFYELVLSGIAGYPFKEVLPADDFYSNMTEILNTYAQSMNVGRYNVYGDVHVWLTKNEYQSVQDMDGRLLGDVLRKWLTPILHRPSDSFYLLPQVPEEVGNDNALIHDGNRNATNPYE